MKLLSPDILEPKLLAMDFVQPNIIICGELSQSKIKPYISGHITDESSTFTFKVNNQNVTVPVDGNGNWKYIATTTITSLEDMLYNISVVDSFKMSKEFNPSSYWRTWCKCSKLKRLELGNSFNSTNAYSVFSNITDIEYICLPNAEFKSVSNVTYFVYNNQKLKTLLMPNAIFNSATSFNNSFTNCYALEDVEIKQFKKSMSFAQSSKLTAQSVVNLFNAVAADGITLTFHATVYNMIEQQLEIEDSPIYEAYWNSDYEFDYASA